jgi:sulfatase maturation enzyme AslB (radical SAM superfamily)
VTQKEAVDVWYLCDQTLCNFDCSYCATQPARRAAGRRMWANSDSEHRYRAILNWIARLPWRIRIRLQTLGEPFVSKEFLRGAAWLSTQDNVDFVELVTNGSFTPRQFEAWASTCAIDRVSLWITYHHTEISAETVVANAQVAHDKGAFIVVHALVFPDNLQKIEHLVQLCKDAGVRTDVTIGHNFNDAYPANGFLPILETQPQSLASLYRHVAALRTMLAAHRGPKGELCSAGHDYIRVDADGSVYPCAPYRALAYKRLGSALDPDFVPALRMETYAPCEFEGFCGCKEDYFHLKAAHSVLPFSKSLGYFEAAPDRFVQVGEGELGIDLVVRRNRNS